MERHLRIEKEIVETRNNDIWKVGYNTNSPIFSEIFMLFNRTPGKASLKNQAVIKNTVGRNPYFNSVILIILRKFSKSSRTLFHKSRRENYAQ